VKSVAPQALWDDWTIPETVALHPSPEAGEGRGAGGHVSRNRLEFKPAAETRGGQLGVKRMRVPVVTALHVFIEVTPVQTAEAMLPSQFAMPTAGKYPAPEGTIAL